MQTKNGEIPRGLDYLTTIRSDQYIEIPADLLGDGMEDFREMVVLLGAPLQPAVGNTDTIMERLEPGEPDREIPTRLAAFANVSAAPIKLEGSGKLAGFYDLYATLSPTQESVGAITFHSDGNGGGTFESRSTFWPLFELRPLGGGESIFVDTGEVPVPGFPMNIGTAGGRWTTRPPTELAVRGFKTRPVFYDGEVIITVNRADQDSARIPMEGGETAAAFIGGPNLIAKCSKIQAEFVSRESLGALNRMNFPATKDFANLEIQE